MNQRKLLIGVAVALAIVLSLLAAFLVLPGPFARMRAMMGGPGQAHPPGGLAAVAPDGAALAAQTASPLPENTAAQTAGGLNVALALNPYPPAGFSTSDFDVTLLDLQGQAVTDAKVRLDLTMPGMWMPGNNFALQHAENGKYYATGRFTMRGLWRIEVVIERGGQKQSVFFDVWI